MRADDKTPASPSRLFSFGNLSADDKTTKTDRRGFVVKSKGTLERRQHDDKTHPPLRVRFCRRRRSPCQTVARTRGGEPLSFAPFLPLDLARTTTKPGHKAERVLSSALPLTVAALTAGASA